MKTKSMRDEGFSLIEVIVALVMIAIVSGAFYQATGTGAQGISVASGMTTAVSVAQSRLNEAAALGPNAGLATSGEEPNGVRWTIKFTEHTVLPPGKANLSTGVVRIDVDASWKAAPHQAARTVQLTTFAEPDASGPAPQK